MMFCLQRWQLCPWCRCTVDFLAGPEVKSNTIKYFTNLGVQGNMNVITPPPPTRTPTSPQDMIRVLCWCEDRNMNYMNVITRPHCTPRHDQGAVLVCAGEHELYYSTHPPTAPHPTLTPTCVGLVRADVCLWRVQMSRSWHAQMRALGVCRWVVWPRSQSWVDTYAHVMSLIAWVNAMQR